MRYPILRTLLDSREQIQKERIRWGQRLKALERGEDTDPLRAQATMLLRYYQEFEALERKLTRDLEELVAEIPICHMMVQVPGVGQITAAKLISLIDLEKSPTVSALWRHCGLAVVDGKAERMRRGETRHYNPRLKSILYYLVLGFLSPNVDSRYAEVYREARRKYERERDWTDGHCHFAAYRKTAKLFLSHLWERWRQLEGLPIRPPYILEHGHTTYLDPSDFGWPTVEEELEWRSGWNST